MDEQVELIKKNAQLVIDQLRPLSDVDFGLNRESVAWVEGYIERRRASPNFDWTTVDMLAPVLGSFLGECIIANAGGSWRWTEERQWGIAFPNNNWSFPFAKVDKLFENGLEGGDSILSFYDVTVDFIATGKFNPGPR